jgi:hypothetical protein
MRTVNDLPRTAQRVSILVFVAVLHAVAYWLLSWRVPAQISGQLPPLQLLMLAHRSSEPAAPAATDHNRRQPLKQSRAPVPDGALTLVAPPAQDIPAKPIDWNAELERAAENGLLDGASHAQRDFGFPHPAPSAPAKPAEFGWDRVHTHRIEAVPGGGLAIHLNDHCVFLLFPLPFLGCGIGSKPANGDLFEHMRDEPR